MKCGFNGNERNQKLTLSLGNLEALSERQRRITGLSTASRRPKCGEMLRLVNDFDQTI